MKKNGELRLRYCDNFSNKKTNWCYVCEFNKNLHHLVGRWGIIFHNAQCIVKAAAALCYTISILYIYRYCTHIRQTFTYVLICLSYERETRVGCFWKISSRVYLYTWKTSYLFTHLGKRNLPKTRIKKEQNGREQEFWLLV